MRAERGCPEKSSVKRVGSSDDVLTHPHPLRSLKVHGVTITGAQGFYVRG
jgi:hypothetical protein